MDMMGLIISREQAWIKPGAVHYGDIVHEAKQAVSENFVARFVSKRAGAPGRSGFGSGAAGDGRRQKCCGCSIRGVEMPVPHLVAATSAACCDRFGLSLVFATTVAGQTEEKPGSPGCGALHGGWLLRWGMRVWWLPDTRCAGRMCCVIVIAGTARVQIVAKL